LGKRGESLAAEWLVLQGYEVLHGNWRYSKFEIDIDAKKEITLHFIEVKTRCGSRFGLPEERVNEKKIQNLLKVGEELLFQNPHWKTVQVDILSISINKNGEKECFLIEDAYLF
jgi:putative endonuclease